VNRSAFERGHHLDNRMALDTQNQMSLHFVMECLNCNRTPITRAIILTENRPWLRKISFAAEYFQLNARCLTFLFVFYRAIYIQFALRCCRQLVYSNIGQKKGDDTCLKLNATCNCQAEQTKCF